MDNSLSGSQHGVRCLMCDADVTSADVLYRVRVQRVSYRPRSHYSGPRMVRAGHAALGGYVICAPCWERLPGAHRGESGLDNGVT